jgi:hypothetical protein
MLDTGCVVVVLSLHQGKLSILNAYNVLMFIHGSQVLVEQQQLQRGGSADHAAFRRE